MTQKYLVFANQAACDTRNHAEAMARNCSSNGETQFWWAQASISLTSQIALLIPDTDVVGLTAAEQLALVTTLLP